MNWVKSLYFKQVAFAVAFAIFIIGSIPAKSMAYVVGSETMYATIDRAADTATVQRVLESRMVSDKLASMGLTSSEIRDRLSQLTDSELHQFARQIDSLYPGGDALGAVIAILIIVILVLLILKITDRKIIIK